MYKRQLDETRGAHQLGLARGLGQRVAAIDGDVLALEADAAEFGGIGPDPLGERQIARPLDDPHQVRHLRLGLDQVAAIGAQHRPLLGPRPVRGMHHQGRVGAGEAGQVTDVEQIGHQHGVQFLLAQAVAEGVSSVGVRLGHVPEPNPGNDETAWSRERRREAATVRPESVVGAER